MRTLAVTLLVWFLGAPVAGCAGEPNEDSASIGDSRGGSESAATPAAQTPTAQTPTGDGSLRRSVPPAMLLGMTLEPGQAVLWHLFHSGFVVRTANRVLVFDPWDGPAGPVEGGLAQGTVNPAEFADREVWVFVTHEHSDHWDRTALAWQETIPNIHYVVSPEVVAASGEWRDAATVTAMDHSAVKTFEGGPTVETFPSRDSGVAFLVTVDGLTLYHSGDHATWNWDRDPVGEALFVQELRPWLDDRAIDIALHVCDPRLEESDWGGPFGFAQAFQPRLFVLMHAKGDYAGLTRFAQKHGERMGAVLWAPDARGDHFVYRGRK